MELDPNVATTIGFDRKNTKLYSLCEGGCSFAATFRIVARCADGGKKTYFMKTGHGSKAKVMFEGEHASLTALHHAVPSICPQSLGHGRFELSPDTFFLVTEFLHFAPRSASKTISKSTMSLAAKLAKLHSVPAPTPQGFDKPVFGFPVTTCCGDTPQLNVFKESWADFFAENRLMFILGRAEAINGLDAELRGLVETISYQVVPRLIGEKNLNLGKGIVPVIVHGDLWSGNTGVAVLEDCGDESEEVIFDSSACYAHSEYELGIMKMFGGFDANFIEEYHRLLPKTKPEEEYADRVQLYELYHHLNHYAIFGRGYRSGSVRIMRNLVQKYVSNG